MSDIIESGTVRFTIDAAFLVETARNLAWMDRERGKARRLLENVKGLPSDAISRILDGAATLSGDSSRGVLLVEEPDESWRVVVVARKRFFAKQRRRAHVRETIQGVRMESVGRWRVPSHLIEQYQLVIARIKSGAFLGVAAAFAGDPLAFLQLEERRVALHDEIMACLDLDRESEDGQDFTAALHATHGLLAGGL